MGRSSARKQAARPGPMQVVAATAAIHIERLATRKQAFVCSAFKRLWFERLGCKPAPRHLGLFGVGDSTNGHSKRLRHHGENHGLLFGNDGLIGVQAACANHSTGDPRRKKAAHHLGRRAVRMRHRLVPNEVDFILWLHVGQKIEKDHLARLHVARHVKHRDTGNAPIAEEHLAALLGTRIARLEFRVHHIEPGIAQVLRILVEIHARANANAGKRLDVRRFGFQAHEHRRAWVEFDIARQDCTRRIATYSAHHRIETLKRTIGKRHSPTTLRQRRRSAHFAFAMFNYARLAHAKTQHIEHRGCFIAVGINAAFILFERKHAEVFEKRHHRFRRKRIHDLLHKFRVVVVGAHNVGIAHIAAAIARDQQLFTNTVGSLEQVRLGALASSRDRRHHARRTAANDCHFWHS